MFAKSKAAEWAFHLILKKLLLVGPVLTVLIILSLKQVSKADAQIKARREQQWLFQMLNVIMIIGITCFLFFSLDLSMQKKPCWVSHA